MSNFTEKQYRLWLTSILGVGNIKAKVLLEMFESAENVFNLPSAKLYEISFLNNNNIMEMVSFREELILEKEAELERLGIKYISTCDEGYPFYLKEIKQPPVILYYKGNLLDLKDSLPISVIGARNCTSYGKEMTGKIAKELALNGAIVVSGLARGVDTYAHKAVVDMGGITVAVIGSGLDVYYPAENRKLFDEICKDGCVFSEFPPGTKPLKQNFPLRNRIIAGISRGIVVVEARARSGTSITVNYASDEGRDVFCIPGNATSVLSDGTNKLIREGAILVTEGSQVLEEYYNLSVEFLKEKIEEKDISKLSTEEKIIYLELKKRKKSTVESLLSINSEFTVDSIIYILMMLEFKRYVKKEMGNSYVAL
ncbi:MAG: DNA-processing protein DprA [Lachnospirales bacterium]